ncbi:MAG: methyltransferase type 11 [Parcubacteria group bacterium Gr01-1014_72]|nr:MAG: methyltransferase type 11 [Parcubacteria group bacterium Gr01-1014_72]
MENIACDLCGVREVRARFAAPDRLVTGEIFQVVECLRCGLVFVNPRPRESEMMRYYPEDYASYIPSRGVARFIKNIFLRREARRLNRSFPKGARLLEVGAGSGEDAAYLRDKTHLTVAGMDTSTDAAHAAEKYFHLQLLVGTLLSLKLPIESFDVLRMKYVLSHVPSPRELLAEASRILKQGGMIYIFIPSVESWGARLFGRFWQGGEPPRHLYDFNPTTITRYLTEAGFAAVRISHSVVPNTWVHSFRTVLAEYPVMRPLSRLFFLNPFSALLFLPLSILAALFRASDRILVVARRSNTQHT